MVGWLPGVREEEGARSWMESMKFPASRFEGVWGRVRSRVMS